MNNIRVFEVKPSHRALYVIDFIELNRLFSKFFNHWVASACGTTGDIFTFSPKLPTQATTSSLEQLLQTFKQQKSRVSFKIHEETLMNERTLFHKWCFFSYNFLYYFIFFLLSLLPLTLTLGRNFCLYILFYFTLVQKWPFVQKFLVYIWPVLKITHESNKTASNDF